MLSRYGDVSIYRFLMMVVAAIHIQVGIAKIMGSNSGCDLGCTGCAQM